MKSDSCTWQGGDIFRGKYHPGTSRATECKPQTPVFQCRFEMVPLSTLKLYELA